MPLVSRRGLVAAVATAGVVLAGVGAANAAVGSGTPAALKSGPSRNVIVVLRNQHGDLAINKGKMSPRVTANRHDQAGAMATARSKGARDVHGFDTLNGYAASMTAAQAAAVAAGPGVLGVYPDLPVTPAPSAPQEQVVKSAGGTGVPSTAICPSDPAKPMLAPEALGVTNTAFTDASKPQAQSIVDGTGIKVAYIADGVDIDNPDFLRPDGSHVFIDYKDFSGEGPDAASPAGEAFGDASAIAAQGRQVYDLSTFVSAAHPLPPGCNITVRGMAPGASLIGLKVFGNALTAPTSRFIQAIDYAVSAGADVLNESFGGNPYPDDGNDPISLADKAAIAAGVTVVSSTGDAGTQGTIGSPSSDDGVIAVGATTTFQSYMQTGFAGVQFSNGTWADDNISSLSSGGITQSGGVPDLVAPGDLGWALCSPDDIYEDCVDDNGNPSHLENFGGTSQSSPLVAGAAALVIEAYENTHHGVRPAPSLVSRLLTGTATDLGHPAFEQGSGLLNSLAAVKAAESWSDANGSPAMQGSALIPDQGQLSVAGDTHQTKTSQVTVRNVGTTTQTVHASTRTLGKVVADHVATTTLNTATAPTFIDEIGTVRSYVKHTFSVGDVDRLDVGAASPTPVSPIRIILIDPKGVYTAYSLPQGDGNYAHVDVRYPRSGTWTAYFALSQSSGFDGKVQYETTTSDFTTHDTVSPSSFTLKPGASKTVKVTSAMGRPGDLSESLQLAGSNGVTTSIPVTVRTVLPPYNDTFKGTITGGNGRANGGPAQTNTYYLDVPKNKNDLSIGVTFTDPNQVVLGYLTAPDGQVYSYTSNLNSDDSLLYNGIQIYRRNPMPGRWVFQLEVTNPISGDFVKQSFTGKVAYNTVKVTGALPDSAKTKLAAGVPVTVPVTVKNTGVIPLTYFADPRLTKQGGITLTELSGNSTVPLPVPAGITPQWSVPTEVTRFSISAQATQPVTLDGFYFSGDPDFASQPSTTPEVEWNAIGGQVSPGFYGVDLGQTGPFSGPAPAGSATLSTQVVGQLFDPAVTSTTDDYWKILTNPALDPALAAKLKARALGPNGGVTTSASKARAAVAKTSGSASPIDLAPGATTTINVTITPSGYPGDTVQGNVYIDTYNTATGGGDELIALPYQYKID
jgi:subtilisin family serine protease